MDGRKEEKIITAAEVTADYWKQAAGCNLYLNLLRNLLVGKRCSAGT